MAKYSVGDEVRVFDVNGPRRGMPDNGWAGTVTAVGRKLMTVSYGGYHNEKFRMDTGHINDSYGHQYVMTEEEVIDRNLASSATKRLKDIGLDLAWRKPKLSGQNLSLLADFAERLLADQYTSK